MGIRELLMWPLLGTDKPCTDDPASSPGIKIHHLKPATVPPSQDHDLQDLLELASQHLSRRRSSLIDRAAEVLQDDDLAEALMDAEILIEEDE